MTNGLVIDDLTKTYGSISAVDGIGLTVSPGEIVGFLGPNGAGKTTTMRAVAGMITVDRGTVTWNGEPVDLERSRRFGYMPQERGLYARMKVAEQIGFFGRLAGLSPGEAATEAARWIDRLGLEARADDLVQSLSGGNQQRVQLAVALVHRPELLLLDEPFAGLDPLAAQTMSRVLIEQAEAGVAVLLSSHQLDQIEELSDRVIIVVDGRSVADGTVADLRAASPVRRLHVRWKEPVAEWKPHTGTVTAFDGRSTIVELPPDHDPLRSLIMAVNAGPIAEVSIEPPSMEQIFADIVTGDKPVEVAAGSNARGESVAVS